MSIADLLKGSVVPADNDSRLPARPAPRGVPGRERMAATPTTTRSTSLIVGCGAGGAVLAQRLARAGWRVVVLERGPFWDPDARLGLRRGGLGTPLLDRRADHRRRRPGRDGQEQLRPRRRRLDGPLRRLHAALPPLRLRDADPRRRRRRLADLLRGPEAALRAGRARAAGRRAGLAVGRPARLPARAAPDRRRRRAGLGGRARSTGSRCASGRSRSPTASSATGRTASTAASACRAAR